MTPLILILHATPSLRAAAQGMWRGVRATAPARSMLVSPACRATSSSSGDGADSDNVASTTNQFKPGGNEGLQSVFGALYPQRLFPDGVTVAMHGHVHLF